MSGNFRSKTIMDKIRNISSKTKLAAFGAGLTVLAAGAFGCHSDIGSGQNNTVVNNQNNTNNLNNQNNSNNQTNNLNNTNNQNNSSNNQTNNQNNDDNNVVYTTFNYCTYLNNEDFHNYYSAHAFGDSCKDVVVDTENQGYYYSIEVNDATMDNVSPVRNYVFLGSGQGLFLNDSILTTLDSTPTELPFSIDPYEGATVQLIEEDANGNITYQTLDASDFSINVGSAFEVTDSEGNQYTFQICAIEFGNAQNYGFNFVKVFIGMDEDKSPAICYKPFENDLQERTADVTDLIYGTDIGDLTWKFYGPYKAGVPVKIGSLMASNGTKDIHATFDRIHSTLDMVLTDDATLPTVILLPRDTLFEQYTFSATSVFMVSASSNENITGYYGSRMILSPGAHRLDPNTSIGESIYSQCDAITYDSFGNVYSISAWPAEVQDIQLNGDSGTVSFIVYPTTGDDPITLEVPINGDPVEVPGLLCKYPLDYPMHRPELLKAQQKGYLMAILVDGEVWASFGPILSSGQIEFTTMLEYSLPYSPNGVGIYQHATGGVRDIHIDENLEVF